MGYRPMQNLVWIGYEVRHLAVIAIEQSDGIRCCCGQVDKETSGRLLCNVQQPRFVKLGGG